MKAAKEHKPQQSRVINNIPIKKNRVNGLVIQHASWDNYVANFETDNGIDSIENSRYQILASYYYRYAPINTYRAPGQEFHCGERTFAYLNSEQVDDLYETVPESLFLKKDKILINPKKIEASYEPSDGLVVFDAKTDRSGNIIGSYHIGHQVKNVKAGTDNFFSESKIKRLRERQDAIIEAQKDESILSDYDVNESIENYYYHVLNGITSFDDIDAGMYSEVIKKWYKETDEGQKIKEIHDKYSVE